MSEPARSLSPLDAGARPSPGPLRDWLATMKAHTAAHAAPHISTPAAPPAPARPEPAAFEADGAAPALREPPAEPHRPARAEAAWAPRLVPPAQPPQAEADPDVAQLMAENLMLKARLQLESERQDDLEAVLADQIRELRQHVADEIGSLDDIRVEQDEIRAEREEFRTERERLRAEREGLRAERDKACADRDALRAEREALAAERDILRQERDLWRARTEALAQPLFQAAKR